MRIKSPVINKSIDYILNHIDDDISVDDVAHYCNFSKYHFSRMFKAETGMSIYSFIKSLKIDQSAVSLKVEKEKTITDIGADFGYSSSNYSSAFSKEFNISPAHFRKSLNSADTYSPFHSDQKVNFKSLEHYQQNITIKNLDNIKVIYERYVGDYSEIGGNWYDIMNRYKKYFKEDTLMIEKSYNDPSISSFEKSIYDLCITVNGDINYREDTSNYKDTAGMRDIDNIEENKSNRDSREAANIKENKYISEIQDDISLEEADITTIKGGKFAVYRFDGFISDIYADFQGIFNVWLPNVSYKRDGRYGLGIYRQVDKENSCVVMDLCIPVK